MSEVLQVEQRTAFGKHNSQRLRNGGRLPAVLYGHGQGTVALSLPAEEFDAMLRHGARVVELGGAAKGQALLQEVQWDTFFHQVLHVDLLRVVAGEVVTVSVPLEMRGEAPGAREGGVVELVVHELELEVTPANVPENLHLNINNLGIGDALTVSDIEDLPEKANVLLEADHVLVHCIERVEIPEEEEGVAMGEAEPEVIGHKEDADQEDGGESGA